MPKDARRSAWRLPRRGRRSAEAEAGAAAKEGLPPRDLPAQVDDDKAALDSYVKAAEAGHVGAMNTAACWYRDGTAGEVDLVQSARWFITMLRYGNGDGVHEIFQFARRMTPEQLREAARLAGDPAAGENFVRVLER